MEASDIHARLEAHHIDGHRIPVVGAPDRTLDQLAVAQCLETVALDLGAVNEQLIATLKRKEAMALIRVEPLDGTPHSRGGLPWSRWSSGSLHAYGRTR